MSSAPLQSPVAAGKPVKLPPRISRRFLTERSTSLGWVKKNGAKEEDTTLASAIRRGPSLRQRLQRLMVSTWVGVALDIMNVVVSLLAVSIYITETYLPPVKWDEEPQSAEEWTAAMLAEIELAFSIYLGADYLLRVYLSSPPWRYIFSLLGLIDLVTVVPVFITYRTEIRDSTSLVVLQTAEILRVLRVVRLSRILPYLESEVRQQLLRIAILLLTVILVATATFHLVEGAYGRDRPFHDWFYFICVSITTVGYGDITPKTVISKMLVPAVVVFSFVQIPIETNRLMRIMTEQSTFALASYRPPRKRREGEQAEGWNLEEEEVVDDEEDETGNGSWEMDDSGFLGGKSSSSEDEGSVAHYRDGDEERGEEGVGEGGCCEVMGLCCLVVRRSVGRWCGRGGEDKFLQVLVTGHVDAGATSGFFHELLHEDHGSHTMHAVILSPRPPSTYVTELLEDPELGPHLTFIQGSPVHDKDLKRASAATANGVFVLVDKFTPHTAAEDASAMLTALSIKKYCLATTKHDVPLFLQLIRPDSKEHLQTVIPPDMRITVVCTEQLTHSLLAMNAVTPGIIALLGNLVSSSDVELSSADAALEEYVEGMGYEIYRVPLAEAYAGVPFQVAAAVVYEETSTLMFG